jgi:hypothetical protein
VSAYQEREAIAARIDALAGSIRRPKYGDVVTTKLEPVVRAATAVLEADPPGEAAPRLRSDPRLPRGGSIPAVEESPWPAIR